MDNEDALLIGEKPVAADRVEQIHDVYEREIDDVGRPLDEIRQRRDERQPQTEDHCADDPVCVAVKKQQRAELFRVAVGGGLVHGVQNRRAESQLGKRQHGKHARKYAVDAEERFPQTIDKDRA